MILNVHDFVIVSASIVDRTMIGGSTKFELPFFAIEIEFVNWFFSTYHFCRNLHIYLSFLKLNAPLIIIFSIIPLNIYCRREIDRTV